MDKKKLIGTIIGVTLFAVLVAGATFAWLTFSLTVTNGNYVSKTKNFVINYVGGTSIVDTDSDEGIPTLAAPTATTARSLAVAANRAANSANGIFYLKMTSTTNNELTTSGALNYAVCKGTNNGTDDAPNLVPTCTELRAGATNVLAAGSVTQTGEIVLYDTSGTDEGIPTTKTYYMVFFWLDASKITNSMTETGSNSYAGYIHASAEQRDF